MLIDLVTREGVSKWVNAGRRRRVCEVPKALFHYCG